jgi:threonine aldolase
LSSLSNEFIVGTAIGVYPRRHSHFALLKAVRMNFASDNTAGIAPEFLEALTRANEGFAMGYGNDALTQRAERCLAEFFEHEVAAFFVTTGTAANALALAHLCPPWGAVLCHAESHIVTDECGAPEFFGGGLRLVGLPGEGCKLSNSTVEAAIKRYSGHRPHQSNAAVLSLTQATEAGTIYRLDEIAALAALAHAHGLKVHMDGARFANALQRLNASPAELTWKAGVDALSFGATKAGALAAEAVVFFDPAAAEFLPERRKRAGHLVSKHRFVAAQFETFLHDETWRRLASHGNAMADRLAQRLAAAGRPSVWPVEANLVFVVLPKALDARLKAAGAAYYIRHSESLPPAMKIGADDMLVRLVTSYATTNDEIDRFAALVANG